MILYDYFRSSAAFRVRIALEWKGLEYERRRIHLRKGEQGAPGYREVNPQGLVPTLVVEGRHFTQSLAIIEYLDDRYPDPPLMPQVFNSQRVKLDLAPYPRIRAIFDACMSLPAFDSAQPSKQPDAE